MPRVYIASLHQNPFLEMLGAAALLNTSLSAVHLFSVSASGLNCNGCVHVNVLRTRSVPHVQRQFKLRRGVFRNTVPRLVFAIWHGNLALDLNGSMPEE